MRCDHSEHMSRLSYITLRAWCSPMFKLSVGTMSLESWTVRIMSHVTQAAAFRRITLSLGKSTSSQSILEVRMFIAQHIILLVRRKPLQLSKLVLPIPIALLPLIHPPQ